MGRPIFVRNSNVGLISHGFRATATYWLALSHLMLSLGVIPCEYVDEPHNVKTRVNAALTLVLTA